MYENYVTIIFYCSF